MKPNALLVSRDRAPLLLLQTALDVLEVQSQVCYTTEEAIDAVVNGEFSAVILDLDLAGAAQVAKMACIASPQRKPLLGAMMGFTTAVSGAFQTGLNFVLHKPLNVEEVTRTLNATKRALRSNRRQSPRFKMKALVHLEYQGRSMPALAFDLSEQGLALQAPESMPQAASVDLRFVLPGTNHKVEGQCDVIWSSEDGKAGMFFSSLTPSSRKHLKLWLSQHGAKPQNAVRVLMPPHKPWLSLGAAR